MEDTRLLVIGGYATAGKDAVANILVKELGWYKTYMSKPLEQALLKLDPWVPWQGVSRENSYWVRYSEMHARIGYDESKKNPEVRRLLQTLGTEIGREVFGPDVWLNAVCKETQEQLDAGRKVSVTGVRYPNEMERFRKLGAEAIWVSRPGVEPINTHSSDNTLDHNAFGIWCRNNGTLEDLTTWVTTHFKGE